MHDFEVEANDNSGLIESLHRAADHPRPLVFLDTETTGLNPDKHEVWEIAALVRFYDRPVYTFCRQLKLKQLDSSDPRSLEVGSFGRRYDENKAVEPEQVAKELLLLTDQAVLLGLNISFDLGFLKVLLGRNRPNWHYSPVDIKSFAAGALGVPPPWPSNDLARQLGVVPGDYQRHNALDDCYFAAEIYDAALTLKQTETGI